MQKKINYVIHHICMCLLMHMCKNSKIQSHQRGIVICLLGVFPRINLGTFALYGLRRLRCHPLPTPNVEASSYPPEGGSH